MLANMGLLFYLHTIHIHRSTFPTGIPENRAVLTSPETFKNRSALNGKPKPMSLTKFTSQTSYYHFYCPLISSKTYRTINKHIKKLKHKQRELHQTKVGFVGTELSRRIRLLLKPVNLVQVHRRILREFQSRSPWSSPPVVVQSAPPSHSASPCTL